MDVGEEVRVVGEVVEVDWFRDVGLGVLLFGAVGCCFVVQVPYPMGPGVWGVVGVLSCVRWSWMAGLAYPGGVVGVVVGLLGQFVGAVVGGVNSVVVPLGRFDAGVLVGGLCLFSFCCRLLCWGLDPLCAHVPLGESMPT